jgi:hypothetical protein
MQRVISLVLAAAVLLGTASITRAESVMKQCGEQWQSAKSAGTTNGATWPQFLAQCRAQLGSGAATAAPPLGSQHPASNGLFIPMANAGRSYPSSDGLDGHRRPKRHETVWRAVASSSNNRRRNLATIPESCRAQLASTTRAPPLSGFAPATPAPAPTLAPTQSVSLFPWQRPAAPPAGSAASTGGGSASAQEAQYRCPPGQQSLGQ